MQEFQMQKREFESQKGFRISFQETPFKLSTNFFYKFIYEDHILTTGTLSMANVIIKVFVSKLNVYSATLPLL